MQHLPQQYQDRTPVHPATRPAQDVESYVVNHGGMTYVGSRAALQALAVHDGRVVCKPGTLADGSRVLFVEILPNLPRVSALYSPYAPRVALAAAPAEVDEPVVTRQVREAWWYRWPLWARALVVVAAVGFVGLLGWAIFAVVAAAVAWITANIVIVLGVLAAIALLAISPVGRACTTIVKITHKH